MRQKMSQKERQEFAISLYGDRDIQEGHIADGEIERKKWK